MTLVLLLYLEYSCLRKSTFQTLPGLEQYSVKKFGEALESIPKALADNAGLKVKFKYLQDINYYYCIK